MASLKKVTWKVALPSGDFRHEVRYEVRWRVNGKAREQRFLRRVDADNKVKELARDELAGTARDPRSGDIPFGIYAADWIETRLVRGRPIAPNTKRNYRELLASTLSEFEDVPIRKINAEAVRRWYSALLQSKGPDRAAKAYRLLRSVLSTAVLDERIGQNPCRVAGGGQYEAPERPMVETALVLRLADAITAPMRLVVILAGFAGLRPEEFLGLRRRDVDLVHRKIRVAITAQEIKGQGRLLGPPKSDAGKRTVTIPRIVVEALDHHLAYFAQAGPDGCLFAGERLGRPLRRNAMYKAWHAALELVPEAPAGLRIYDLRHHAATTAARMPGITTKELMARIGHSSPRAALKYQHATEERDEKVASWLDDLVDAATAMHAAEQRAPVIPIGAGAG